MYGSTRTFNKRLFYYVGSFKYKKYASQTAKHIRHEGGKARVIHDRSQKHPYAVYRS